MGLRAIGRRAADAAPAWSGAAPTRVPRVREWAWRVFVAMLAVCLVLSVVTVGGWIWLSHAATAYPGAHFDRGLNGIWLEHTWAGDAHTAGEYDTLAARLRRERIHYVFAHVGPLRSDGSVAADRYEHALDLLDALKARVPGVEVLAWLGQLSSASGAPADETVNLDNPSVRQEIAESAAYFTGKLGFDGVHYDIEPMINNGPRFLDLLDVTRTVIGPAKMLSTSAPMWAPNAHLAEWLRTTVGKGAGYWTSYYYAAVATHVDQLVVMDYNTALPSGALYTLDVKQQTQNILAAVRAATRPPQVLIGLPTYHENSFWFHDAAENPTNGLAGVIAGLNSETRMAPFAGVALYRYGTTGSGDWVEYERLWLGA